MPLPITNHTTPAAIPVVVVPGKKAQAPAEALPEFPHEILEQIEALKQDVPSLEPLTRTMVWDVPFDCVTAAQATDRIEQLVERRWPSYVITANMNYVMLHGQQPDIPEITYQADLILADGQPIVWRSRAASNPLPERVAGSELIYELACRAGQKKWGIYFLGGEPGIAEKCANQLKRDYPSMRIAGIESPPFRELTQEEQEQQDQRIRDSDADILLVAFGQPKGERWIHQNYQRLGIPVSIQLGASFDFVAGNAKRAPQIYRTIGCEWAYRMCGDPRRLVPRYWSNAMFLAKAMVKEGLQTVAGWGMKLEEPSRPVSHREQQQS